MLQLSSLVIHGAWQVKLTHGNFVAVADCRLLHGGRSTVCLRAQSRGDYLTGFSINGIFWGEAETIRSPDVPLSQRDFWRLLSAGVLTVMAAEDFRHHFPHCLLLPLPVDTLPALPTLPNVPDGWL